MPAKDRSDPIVQTIAAEAIAIASARALLAKMSDVERQAFAKSASDIAIAIGTEIKAQAPAIGRTKGIAAEAANGRAAMLAQQVQDLVKGHLADLLGGK